jgi:hypothetical protein
VIFEDNKLTDTLLISRVHKKLNDNIHAQCSTLTKWRKTYETHSSALVVVEIPRIYPGSPQRDNDIVDLSVMAGALAAVCVGSHDAIMCTHPRDWKGTVPKHIYNARVLENYPELIARLEKYPKSKQEHIIDAFGIGLWAQGRKMQASI